MTTKRHRDRPWYSVCSNRLHLVIVVIQSCLINVWRLLSTSWQWHDHATSTHRPSVTFDTCWRRTLHRQTLAWRHNGPKSHAYLLSHRGWRAESTCPFQSGCALHSSCRRLYSSVAVVINARLPLWDLDLASLAPLYADWLQQLSDMLPVSPFLVKDDDEESEVPQATCRTDSPVSRRAGSLTPAEIFAANSGTALFCCCSTEVWYLDLFKYFIVVTVIIIIIYTFV